MSILIVGIIVNWTRTPQKGPVVATVTLGQAGIGMISIDTSTSRVFIVNGPSTRVSVLDTMTGTLMRSIALPMVASALAVAEREGHVFVGAGTSIQMLDARDGQPLRTTIISPNPINNTLHLVIDESQSRLYVANSGSQQCMIAACTPNDGIVDVLDAHTGRLLRIIVLRGQGVTSLALDTRTHHLLVTGGSTIPGHGYLSVIDPAVGRVLKRLALNTVPTPWIPPVVDSMMGRVVVTGDPSIQPGPPRVNVDVLDTQRSRRLRTISLLGVAANTVIDEQLGVIFITDSGPVHSVTTRTSWGSRVAFLPVGAGSLHVLDAHTGAVRRTITLTGTPIAVVVDMRHRHVLVLQAGRLDAHGMPAGTGSIAVIDERGKRLLRTVQIGMGAFTMALDVRSSHLFLEGVESSGAAPNDFLAWLPYWLRRYLPAPTVFHNISDIIMTLDTADL